MSMVNRNLKVITRNPRYDEELENDENEIQPAEGDNNCFISL
jgi:hypothetical protein